MIELKNINLKLNNKIIFKDLNLHLKKNQKILLRMPSGTGKSTLLKIIMGYIPIDSGEITVNGIPLSEDNIDNIRQKFAYIGQNITFSEKNVEEYIKLIFSFERNKTIDFSEKYLKDLLIKFQLEENILKKSPSKLSGGEKQRIAIIIVLLLDREILLLDEVTSGLDHELKVIVIDLLRKLDKTIIISSHDNQWLDYEEFKVIGW